jgi:hypothetical protein
MKLSKQATKELKEIRKEMKKEHPDGAKIFELMCGKKYNKPLYDED